MIFSNTSPKTLHPLKTFPNSGLRHILIAVPIYQWTPQMSENKCKGGSSMLKYDTKTGGKLFGGKWVKHWFIKVLLKMAFVLFSSEMETENFLPNTLDKSILIASRKLIFWLLVFSRCGAQGGTWIYWSEFSSLQQLLLMFIVDCWSQFWIIRIFRWSHLMG